MNGRALSAIFMLLVLLAAGLVSTPALSGEHPWDSDATGGDEPTLADYDWDTRAADSAQLDIPTENVDEDQASSAPPVDASISSIFIGLLSALSIGL